MSFPQAVSIPDEVMARQLGDEIVILDLASGNYFGLDAVGARMWQLISEGEAVPRAFEILLSEYEVMPEQLRTDMERLLQDLLARGLVRFD